MCPRLLNPDLPAEFERIISRALEKDPDVRYQTASDLRAELKRLKRDTESERPAAAVAHETGPSDKRAKEKGAPGALLRRRWAPMLAGLIAMLLTGSGVAWFVWNRAPTPREPKQRRLTANPVGNPATDALISPDGKYLVYADQSGIRLQLIETGETRTVAQPEGLGAGAMEWSPAGWFPDGTKFLANRWSPATQRASIWVVSMLGGAAREIRDEGYAWSVSPDGSLIAFTTDINTSSDIWLMGANGEQPRKTVTAGDGESLSDVVWSPDGQRIAYIKRRGVPAPDSTMAPESTIESRSLNGGQPTLILSDTKLAAGLWWSQDGRIFCSLRESADNFQMDTNLWEVKLDPQTGKTGRNPRRLTHWPGFLQFPNGSADGKRLVFVRGSPNGDVYVSELEANGTRLKTSPRRLTLDERDDWPTAWTPDSKAVIFFSNRNGNLDIFKQPLDKDAAEPVVATPQVESVARLSWDGSWILYWTGKADDLGGWSAPVQLMRVSLSGGAPQIALTARRLVYTHRCARAPSSLCLVAELSPDNKQVTFTAFDPVQGRGREVTRVSTDGPFFVWDLSPDGSRIALAKFGENRIRILPVAGGDPRDITVKGWRCSGNGLDWSADGKGFYVSKYSPRSATLLYVDLEGRATALWEQKGSWMTWGVPSPDGRHLAILGMTGDSNAWMIENF